MSTMDKENGVVYVGTWEYDASYEDDEGPLPQLTNLICDGNEENLVVYSKDGFIPKNRIGYHVDSTSNVGAPSGNHQKEGSSTSTKAQDQQSEFMSMHPSSVNSSPGLDGSCTKQSRRVHSSAEINEYNKKVLLEHVKSSTIFCLYDAIREGKKLLVLDVDQTLCDAEQGFTRPYLNQFLTAAYHHYDIAIWSATPESTIIAKLFAMAINDHPSFKIALLLDRSAMLRIDYSLSGDPEKKAKVKPLCVIWNYFHAYSRKNTIMIDDKPENFKMNPQCGLCIEPFRPRSFKEANKDTLLYQLKCYLTQIASVKDFTTLDHSAWQSYGAGVSTD